MLQECLADSSSLGRVRGFLGKVTYKQRWVGFNLEKEGCREFFFPGREKNMQSSKCKRAHKAGVGAPAVLCRLWEQILCSIFLALSSHTGCCSWLPGLLAALVGNLKCSVLVCSLEAATEGSQLPPLDQETHPWDPENKHQENETKSSKMNLDIGLYYSRHRQD